RRHPLRRLAVVESFRQPIAPPHLGERCTHRLDTGRRWRGRSDVVSVSRRGTSVIPAGSACARLCRDFRRVGSVNEFPESPTAPSVRPRRLRNTPAMRRLVGETSLEPRHLVLPAFVADGIDEPRPISSLPGVYQHTIDSLRRESAAAAGAGLGGIMLFGVPREQDKDARGTCGADPDGILNRALRAVREEVGDDLVVMADTCLDEFTDHGHCGVLGTDPRGEQIVDNDATLLAYNELAVAQAAAGAHVVSPSGMMDGQIASIRHALDLEG